LGFVEDDNCEPQDVFVAHVVQRLNALARDTALVMRNDVIFDSIPAVVCVLEDKDSLSNARVPRHDAEDARGLARKHGTQNNVERHLRLSVVLSLNGRPD
jgi:hypothetical protein